VGSEFGKLCERFLARADSQHVVIPLAEEGFVTFAGILLILDDEDALHGMIVRGHQN